MRWVSRLAKKSHNVSKKPISMRQHEHQLLHTPVFPALAQRAHTEDKSMERVGVARPCSRPGVPWHTQLGNENLYTCPIEFSDTQEVPRGTGHRFCKDEEAPHLILQIHLWLLAVSPSPFSSREGKCVCSDEGWCISRKSYEIEKGPAHHWVHRKQH